MKRFTYLFIIVLGISVLSGTGTSCKKEVFDADKYDTIIKYMSPVDTVDATHKWELTTSSSIIVTADVGAKTKQVQILDNDPMSTDDAQVITQLAMSEGEKKDFLISYPSYKTELYAAAVDSTGVYTVSSFNPQNSEIDFSNPLYKLQKLSYTPKPQYYAFCYEQEYPEPGDYDYNDVVMHIALEQISSKVIYFHVRLAGVGATQQLAGCIRLPEFLYEDIDSVWTVNGESFNKGISDQYMIVLKERELLLRGLNNEAVINLFADAHWATGDLLNADYGKFTRKEYNVTKQSGSKAQLMVPREITFAMRTKADNRVPALTLDNIDPFVIKEYNSGKMEVHTYKYRMVNALNQYTFHDAGNLPWALKVPLNWFLHPLQGINIGFRMRDESGMGILFGAYAKSGHAFGEWAMDKSKALDWFLYPDNANVFIW